MMLQLSKILGLSKQPQKKKQKAKARGRPERKKKKKILSAKGANQFIKIINDNIDNTIQSLNNTRLIAPQKYTLTTDNITLTQEQRTALTAQYKLFKQQGTCPLLELRKEEIYKDYKQLSDKYEKEEQVNEMTKLLNLPKTGIEESMIYKQLVSKTQELGAKKAAMMYREWIRSNSNALKKLDNDDVGKWLEAV